MKKLFITSFLIILTHTSAFASEDLSIFSQIKNIFVREQPKQQEFMRPQADTFINSRAQSVQPMQQAFTFSATTSEVEQAESTSTKEIRDWKCQEERKLVNKIDRTERMKKSHLDDKERVTKTLEKVEQGNVSNKVKRDIKEKKTILNKEVNDVIVIEDNIINIASSTVVIACEDGEEEKLKEGIVEIKRLDQALIKEASEVNTFIQKDIRDFIKNIK